MKIGFLGGGQLARMMALAGYPLGLRFRCMDPNPHSPAAELMDSIIGRFDDEEALAKFADGLDMVTIETENIPVSALSFLQQRGIKFQPGIKALATAQDRLHEKSLFQKLGIPTAAFHSISTLEELEQSFSQLGKRAILKTRRDGYDGKGQFRIQSRSDCQAAMNTLGGRDLILEDWLDFDGECSLISVRNTKGHIEFYPLVRNVHREGILFSSEAFPLAELKKWQLLAETHARKILDALDYVGVLTIEFFMMNDQLLANEMAPRVHNSGHWTIEAAACSQFENHLRAILDWPLGSTLIVEEFLMLNIIGSMPGREDALKIPGLHLHDYSKAPKPQRKLGHITLIQPTADRIARTLSLVEAARI